MLPFSWHFVEKPVLDRRNQIIGKIRSLWSVPLGAVREISVNENDAQQRQGRPEDGFDPKMV